MSNPRRPDFIPSEIFRMWLTPAQLRQWFTVDGILPGSYIQRCANKYGRPIPYKIHNGSRCYRILDVVARARAECDSIGPIEEETLWTNIQDLRDEYASLAKSVKARKHTLALDQASVDLTTRKLLREHEVVAGAFSSKFAMQPGVYFLIKRGKVVYVGQSVNGLARVAQHTESKGFDSFAFMPCERCVLDVLESLYICFFEPPLNGRVNGPNGTKGNCRSPLSFQQIVHLAAKKKDQQRGQRGGAA